MEPFRVKDCSLITGMGGVEPAMNLRELRDRLAICPVECLQHHFCEPVLRATFDDPEFRNDFAVWAARDLRDRPLGERLGAINPYSMASFQALRELVLEIIDERQSELPTVPWVPRGSEFRFMKSLTIVFETEILFESVADLALNLPRLTTSSIYYHFVIANLRTPERTDDFSAWLATFGQVSESSVRELRGLDFYYLTLGELKREISAALSRAESQPR